MRIASFVLILLFVQISSLIPFTQAQTESVTPTGKARESKEVRIQLRQSFLEGVKEKREEAKEEFKERREEFKLKMQGIRDARKKKLAENIDERLAAINKKHTDRMSEALDKLYEILERIKIKTEEHKSDGMDVEAVETAIADAEEAISEAEDALSTQAGKEYIADVSNETTLKTVFGQVVRQLKADLKATHLIVLDARKAVRLAATELANPHEDAEEASE